MRCALPRPAEADHAGLYLRIGPGGARVLAPIAPGMVCRVPVQHHHWLLPGDSVPITHRPCILALDGEREVVVSENERMDIRLTWNGPQMIHVRNTLKAAADRGYFVQEHQCLQMS